MVSDQSTTRALRFRDAFRSILVIALASVATAAVAAESADDAEAFAKQFRPLLVEHCSACHAGEKPKGDFRLDSLTADFSDKAVRARWHAVVEQLTSGSMPPKEKPRPPAEQTAALATWAADRLAAVETAERAAAGRVVLRRLNRTEYENTVRDLLGIEVKLKEQLPEDGSANGFDNAGAALHTSSFLMERYLEAADTALNLAIVDQQKPPPSTVTRSDLKKSHPIRTTTEKVYRFDDETVVCFCSSAWHNVSLSNFYPQQGGRYRFRIATSAVQSDGKPVTFRVTAGNTRLTGTDGLVGYYDAVPGEPRVLEFERYMEPRTTIGILPYGLPSAQTVNKIGGDVYDGPGLALHWAEVEGPLNEIWPPASHRGIFGDLPQKPAPIYNRSTRVEVDSPDPMADAEQILRRFCRRAFRRTVTDADVRPFVEVVQLRLDGGASFEQAVRAALKGVMISPEFLFLREAPGRLDDFALASRLSYFLWSTMPDDELLGLAERGELSRSEVLRGQVERMLDDPKSQQFTINFVGQWLSLREIDFTEPSHILYPEFDHLLKVSMIRETELFFDEVLRGDLSLTNFVDSDFTMLNGRLAKHYGIAGIDGWEFQRVALPPESERGGVMTMASVLKVTANGTLTSPVVRGAWVLDRILGAPAPPPPSDVPAIDPDIRGATTIREQLAKHRADAACAVCHNKIDPPGFALESFDCIGGWRTSYRVTGSGKSVVIDGRRMSYHEGKPVDPSDALADGRKFADVREFKQLLLADKDALARALTTKLLTYATGAMPTAADRPKVDAIVAAIREKNYGFRSLVHEVVMSELFRTK